MHKREIVDRWPLRTNRGRFIYSPELPEISESDSGSTHQCNSYH